MHASKMKRVQRSDKQCSGFYKFIRALALILLFLGVASNGQNPKNQHNFPLFLSTLGKQYGARAQKRGGAWINTLNSLQTASVEEQVEEINKFFNIAITWSSDQRLYGRKDFWATPGETLGRGAGDCEDFTIAKYVSLKTLGIPSEQLRLTYVTLQVSENTTQAHMVLAWYPEPNAPPLILDNVNPRILAATARKDLTPVFSFNSDEIWLGNQDSPYGASPSARISQWRQLVARAESEGIAL